MTPIKTQLSQIVILVITIVVALMSVAFFLVELISFQQIAIETTVPQAQTIAINLRTSLVLRDLVRSQEIMATLAADSSIEGAYLFNRQQETVAYYQPPRRAGEKTLHIHSRIMERSEIEPIMRGEQQVIRFSPQALSVFVPINHNNTTIGTVYLVRSLSPFYARLFWWIFAAAIATTIAVTAGIAFSRRLQQTIAQPIIALAETMAVVTQEEDLSVRAVIPAEANELSALASGFNTMLEGINERDQRIASINAGLEVHIAERTQELSSLLHEKELLLREVHHRVKNNLQIISSLLNLQIKKVKDPGAIDALQTSLSRTRSISLIHERLYTATGQTPTNDLGEYLSALAQEIFRLYNISPQRISLHVYLAKIHTDFDRLINLALILNELLTNTFKHAFAPDQTGTVTIRLQQKGETLILSVGDNGIGLPEAFAIERSATVGLRLTENLVRKAGGRFTLERAAPGTEAIVVYPLATSDPTACPTQG